MQLHRLKKKTMLCGSEEKQQKKINIQDVSSRLESVITKKQKSMIAKWKKYKSEREKHEQLTAQIIRITGFKI